MASSMRKAGETVVQGNKVAQKFANMTLPRDMCTRCNKAVYATEKEKSANGAIFHKQCFSCAVVNCRQKLNHNNAKTNPNGGDPEIYCQGHVPKVSGVSIGPDAVHMMRLKQYSDMQKKLNKRATLKTAKMDADAIGIRSDMVSQAQINQDNHEDGTAAGEHHIPAVLIDANEQYQSGLRVRQEELEKQQKEEEDKMFKKFEEERREAANEANKESELEWESKLKDIIAMLEKNSIDEDEFERRKREALKEYEARKNQRVKNKTMRIIQKQQRETSALVDKQGDEMLKLIKDQKTQLAKDMQAQLHNAKQQASGSNPEDSDWLDGMGEESLNIEEMVTEIVGMADPPSPRAPKNRKSDIMPEEEDDEFSKVFDKHVANVAENDQTTFTELIHVLTGPFMDDLSKARAIYRWITYKDLNKIQFSEALSDSPMGLLRGIKYGTETYHTLFKRLCSYAGLHCVEVNGRSKSVGYEPGMKFESNAFRNTWNSVLIDGEWRLVQCNWGARFLVINKDKTDNKSLVEPEKKDDSIKYQYDEHYFLTDPEEFIQEFFPLKPEWQLLEKPISQEDFEAQPLVRSIFFHLGLKFKKPYPAVLDATKVGGVDVRIIVPEQIVHDTAFLYQLRFSDRERAHLLEYNGAKLDRFVYQSINDNEVIYSVHLPAKGEYYLQVFASKMDTPKPGQVTSLDGVKLKCVCKFKIVCNEMDDKMSPLPNCAPGEWGPKKALRQFLMTPVSHMTGVVSAENSLKVKFTTGKPLVFLAKLKMNDVDDGFFQDFVDAQYDDEHLRVKVGFPIEGQYGLDIYAKSKSAPINQPLAHACKYLINVTSIKNPVDVGVAKLDGALEQCMGKWGRQHACSTFSITPLTHANWKIKINTTQAIIRLQAPGRVVISAHLIKEPDYDYKDHLIIQRDTDCTVTLTAQGLKEAANYMLIVMARMDDDDSTSYTNVFNYLIKSTYGLDQVA